MNKLHNPFTPGAGFLPPELAGRAEIIENGQVLAERTRLLRSERGMMLIGPRGVGKTSILKFLAEDARKRRILPVIIEIQNDKQGIEELSFRIREALNALDFECKVKTRVREAFAALGNFIRRFSVNVGPVGIELEPCGGIGGSGNLESDLSEVLLTVARAAKDAGTAIGLYVDEFQNMSLEAVRGIVFALHHAAQELLPLYLVGSGLPTVRTQVAKSKTYAERMFTYESIGALDAVASSDAIRKPLEAMDVEIEDGALDEVFRMSGGYPFFLQECGYQLWLRAERSPIAQKDAQAVLPGVMERLDRNFFDVRFDRISELERRFLRVMADVPDRGGCEISSVAEALGRSANSLSMVRRSLIRKGVLYSPRLGAVAYTVPLFGAYLKRAMATAMLVLGLTCLVSVTVHAEEAPLTDGEVWNQGVEHFRAGDVTNALRVLRPLMLSKTHGPRAAEVVAKLEYDRGNLEEAAGAAQIALRAAPGDAKANRNFTRATDGLPQLRETKRINAILQGAQGKDPGALMLSATKDARRLMANAGSYRTNAPARAVALADALSRQAEKLADTWIPVREVIAQSVTNEEQAATILQQIESAQAKTKKAAKELGDLGEGAYGTISDVEHDFTRFLKLTVLPPAAVGEDIVAQSNAWQDVEAFNGRVWQQDALDYTRAFRAKFPAWARAYEQQAQADTNKPPFTAEDQAKVSALATELEKLQLECCEKSLPPNQEKALEILRQIQELLPKDKNGGGGQQSPQQNPQNQDRQQNQQDQQQDQQQQQNQQESDQQQDQDPSQQSQESPPSQDEAAPDEKEDQELEATLKKAQERNDEHEAEKKARMRKAPLPPNERDW